MEVSLSVTEQADRYPCPWVNLFTHLHLCMSVRIKTKRWGWSAQGCGYPSSMLYVFETLESLCRDIHVCTVHSVIM